MDPCLKLHVVTHNKLKQQYKLHHFKGVVSCGRQPLFLFPHGDSRSLEEVIGTKLNFPAIAPCLKRDVEVDTAAASKDKSAPENSDTSNNELKSASTLPATLRRMLLSLRPFTAGNYDACVWQYEPNFPTVRSATFRYTVRVFAKNLNMFMAVEAVQEVELSPGTTKAEAEKMISKQPWASRVVRSSL